MFAARRTIVAALALFSLSACAGKGQGPQGATPRSQPTEITIENNSTNTVDVFIVYHDQTFRVDQVFSLTTETASMPRFIVPPASVRALVDPVGPTYAYLSDPVEFVGNENFLLTIEDDLALSSFVPVGGDR